MALFFFFLLLPRLVFFGDTDVNVLEGSEANDAVVLLGDFFFLDLFIGETTGVLVLGNNAMPVYPCVLAEFNRWFHTCSWVLERCGGGPPSTVLLSDRSFFRRELAKCNSDGSLIPAKLALSTGGKS